MTSKNLEYNNPPITSIRFDTVRLGKMACAKLLNILGEATGGYVDTELSGDLCVSQHSRKMKKAVMNCVI